MPNLIHFQLRDGPHAGEPISERGEIERLARECETAECDVGLDSTVVETRFNVVRSSVPAVVETARKLRDYLPPEAQDGRPRRAAAPLRASLPGRSRAGRHREAGPGLDAAPPAPDRTWFCSLILRAIGRRAGCTKVA